MDVIAEQVASLRGRLSIDTIPGAGTTFHIQIPVPHLLMSCVLLKAGDRTFAIPAEDIITTNLLGNLNAAKTVDPSYVYSWVIQEATGVVPGLSAGGNNNPDFGYLFTAVRGVGQGSSAFGGNRLFDQRLLYD